MQAHTEILRRGGELLEEAAARLATVPQDDEAALHLIWLAGASGNEAARKALVEQARSKDNRLRLQAIRALTEYKSLQAPRQVFAAALADTDPQVQHAAVLAHFDGKTVPEAIKNAVRSKDSYLRQAAALLYSEKASLPELRQMCQAQDPALRLAGVLAAGFRLTLPPATEPIPEHLPLDPEFRGPVIEFADEAVDLRKLGRIGNFTTADHWKVGRHTPEQTVLFELLVKMLQDQDEQIRLQAAHFLSLVNDPRSEPAVVRVRTASEDRRLAIAPLRLVDKLWLCGPFDDGSDGFERVHPPEQGAVDLAAAYSTPRGTVNWNRFSTVRIYDLVSLLGPCEKASCYAYFRLESGARQRVNLLVGSDDGIRVWHNGRVAWTNDTTRAALPYQDVVVLELEPGSNEILLRVRNLTGSAALFAHYRSLASAVHVLPEKVGLESLAERLKSAEGTPGSVPAEFLTVDWSKAAREGNAEQGRKLYEAAGCVKCHAVTIDAAVTGGPSLADAARRFTVPHLVESILLPSKQVSPVFKATAIVTKDGRQLNGLVVGETAEKLELLQPDTKRITLAKGEIDQRQFLELSPMPQGVLKKPEELRDLLAYLLQASP
jgi:putative heme-binding domain-containing protein